MTNLCLFVQIFFHFLHFVMTSYCFEQEFFTSFIWGYFDTKFDVYRELWPAGKMAPLPVLEGFKKARS